MTKIYLLTVFVVLQIYTCSKKEIDDFDYAMEKMNDKGKSVGGKCPSGRWRRPAACSSNPNPPYFYYVFDASNNTGYTSNPDCNGICTPLKFYFTWKPTSSTTLSYTFTGADDVYCSGVNQGAPKPNTTTSYTLSYECIDATHCKFQTTSGMLEFEKF